MPAVQVSVSHQGSYRFKGIPGVHTVLSLSHGHLTGRCEAAPWLSASCISRLHKTESRCRVWPAKPLLATSVWHPPRGKPHPQVQAELDCMAIQSWG